MIMTEHPMNFYWYVELKLKLLLKTNHEGQGTQIAFKEEGGIIFLWLFVFFLLNNGLSLPVYISVGVQQYLHNISFVCTQSEKFGNLRTVYCVNYSRCLAYLRI